MYQLHGAPLNAKTVGGPGKNTLLPPPLSGPGATETFFKNRHNFLSERLTFFP